MREIDSRQIVQTQRRAATQDDLPGVPLLAELELDLLPEACVGTLGQQRHMKASGSSSTQETLNPPLRDQDFL